VLQVAEDARQWHRVQNAIRRYAALARHLDAPVHVVELADRMRIRIDAHYAAEVQSGLVPPPIEIETPRMGVDLNSDVVRCAGAQHLFDVDFVSGAALELASGHVSDDRRITIGDCSQKPLGLCFPIELEAAVDAGDHEIKPVEDIVRIVQGAVGQDVGFNSLQNPEFLAELPVEPVGLAVLLLDLLEREPAGVVRRPGMSATPKY
jgi:hypothetical protein